MIIECDTRQQKQEHIVKAFDEAGIKYIRNKLYCGDYKRVDSPKVIIDTKKNLLERSIANASPSIVCMSVEPKP